jgi:hypothetical protein
LLQFVPVILRSVFFATKDLSVGIEHGVVIEQALRLRSFAQKARSG